MKEVVIEDVAVHSFLHQRVVSLGLFLRQDVEIGQGKTVPLPYYLFIILAQFTLTALIDTSQHCGIDSFQGAGGLAGIFLDTSYRGRQGVGADRCTNLQVD